MKGHIQRRGKDSYRLKFDIGVDPQTQKRRVKYITVRGGRRDAEARLNTILASIGEVRDDKRKAKVALAKVLSELAETPIENSSISLATHVLERINQWKAAGRIGLKTAERYGELARNQIIPHLGDMKLIDLRPADIEKWHTKLKTAGRVRPIKAAASGVEAQGNSGLAPHTVRHAHRLLSKALKDAVKNELVMRNVAALEGAPPVNDDEEVVILTDERVSALLAKLKGHRMYTRAITTLFTGLRRGELLALRWPNAIIDGAGLLRVREALEETRAGIRFKKPKTKRGTRDLTLPDIVVDALRDERDRQLRAIANVPPGAAVDLSLVKAKLAGALVFPAADGTPMSPRALSKEWSATADQLGMPDVTFHALRHTHASQLIDQDVDVVTISKRLGHASPTVTLRIYAHLFRKDDGKASDAINAALAKLSST